MKVGDYVRFKTLSREIKIGKVIEIIAPDKNSMRKYCVYDLDNNEVTVDDYIIKSSPNIIDLIEVGDYVNGVRVDEIVYIGHGTIKDLEISFRYKYAFEKDDVYTLKEQDIISIVTKEAFESMEYKIGE